MSADPADDAGATREQPVRDAIDRWQQARPLTAVPLAVAKKFTDDGASRLAALIAYWSFFSIFPLLLAFASILGFLLEGNPVLFTGDTLFPGGPGTTKNEHGDFATIIESIDRRLFTLPGETLVLPGHGLDTTIGTERPHLQEWIDRGW